MALNASFHIRFNHVWRIRVHGYPLTGLGQSLCRLPPPTPPSPLPPAAAEAESTGESTVKYYYAEPTK